MCEEFCAEAGIDEVPDLNSDQRLIIVGSERGFKKSGTLLTILNNYREWGTS